MQVFKNNQVCKIDMTGFYIYFILKENIYIIQFISKHNQFESLNMSMVPQIENPTHKLDIWVCLKPTLVRESFQTKTIKSVIMIIPCRNKVKEARSICSLILKIV